MTRQTLTNGRMQRVLFSAAAAAAVAALNSSAAMAQLRIVSLNSANSSSGSSGPRTPWMNTILSAIGSSVSDDPTNAGASTGIIRPIDILCLQECAMSNGNTTSGYYGSNTTAPQFASLMNSIYSTTHYVDSGFSSGTVYSQGSGTQGVVYNSDVVQLVGTTLVGVAVDGSQLRKALRFQFRPVGYDSSADIYIYNSHYKASQGTTEENQRNDEAVNIRANADALGAGKNIIYIGDFNVYDSGEPMWATLTSAGNAQAVDPINKVGNWHVNQAFKNVHTQSPYDSATADALGTNFSGTTGGMDDRFDFQLTTAGVLDGDGFAYIPNSYQAFGNVGNHNWNSGNGFINDGTSNPQPSNVLNALAGTLDHLPVVADYQLPAKLGVSVGTQTPKMIRNTPGVTIGVTVSNTAPVQYANGADSLSYSLSTSGSLSGSASGSDAALGSSNTHNVTYVTSAVGNLSGSISVTSTSQQVASNNFAQNVNFQVVDHSNGSFVAPADTDALTFDYGYVPQSFTARTNNFSIHALAAASGFTADLRCTSVTPANGGGVLSTNGTTFNGLAAGAQQNFVATMNPLTVGAFTTATSTFALADEVIPGATSNTSLVLSQSVRVVSATSPSFPVTGFIELRTGETFSPSGTFAISSGVTLTRQGPGTLNVGTQSNGDSSTLALVAGTTTFNADAGAAGSYPMTVTTANAGTVLHLNSTQHLANLSIGTGTNVDLAAGSNKVLLVKSLSTTGTGRMDITDNRMAVLYGTSASPIDAIKATIVAGRNGTDFLGGDWNGTGIVSSTAAAADLVSFAIGYVDNSFLPLVGLPSYISFGGQTVDSGSMLIRYTLGADCNLDGKVNTDDVTIVGALYNSAGSGDWFFGDFDYDGIVDSDDVTVLGALYDATAPALSGGQLTAQFGSEFAAVFQRGQTLGANVPEPAGLVLLGAFAPLFARRRSRKVLWPS